MLLILRNRSHLGEVTFRDGSHQPDEPLIDPVLLERAQSLLAARGESYDRRMPSPTSTTSTTSRPGSSPAQPAAAATSASAALDEGIATATTRASPASATARPPATAELRRTEAAIERYILVFEAGAISAGIFGPRVRDLGERVRTLEARLDELEHAADHAAMHPPARADIDTLQSELTRMVAHGTDARRKAAAQAFVHRLALLDPASSNPATSYAASSPQPDQNPEQTAPTPASRAVPRK